MDCDTRSKSTASLDQDGDDTNGSALESSSDTSLHVLFCGPPESLDIRDSVQLTELMVLSYELTRTPQLDQLRNLKKLWLCECNLKKIPAVHFCPLLEELYLYDNLIESIEHLEKSSKLRVLWLNDNAIKTSDGLRNLTNLVELNLSNNYIDKIGYNFSGMRHLNTLYLNGNSIDDLREVLPLSYLPGLMHLVLNRAGCRKNPICENVNLPLIILFHFPNLKYLDFVPVSDPELRCAVLSVVQFKQAYYTSKVQRILSKRDRMVNNLTMLYNTVYSEIASRLKVLDCNLKRMQIQANSSSLNEITHTDNEVFRETWMNKLKTRITFWEQMLGRHREEMIAGVDGIFFHAQQKVNLLRLELQYCGYLEFQEGSPDDLFFQQCSNLMAAKSCCHEFSKHGISGIKILSIHRVIYTSKENNYSSEVPQCHEQTHCDDEVNGVRVSTMEDYCILIRSTREDQLIQYNRILQPGYDDSNNNIGLTNCLSVADRVNLFHDAGTIVEERCSQFDKIATFIILRVLSNSLTQEDRTDTKDENSSHKQLFKQNPNCICSGVYELWLSSCRGVAVPEFLVQIEYLMEEESRALLRSHRFNKSVFDIDLADEIKKDVSLVKQIPGNTESDNSCGKVHVHRFDASGRPQSLIVYNVSQSQAPNYQKYDALTHLQINHCQLQVLPNLTGVPLTLLDVSYNKLQSLDTLSFLPNLTSLNINHNLLVNIIATTHLLKKQCANIQELCLKWNPWIKYTLVTSYTVKYLTELTSLDGLAVTKETDSAVYEMKQLTGWTLKDLLPFAFFDASSLDYHPCLSLESIACCLPKLTASPNTSSNGRTWSCIVSLNLDNCGIYEMTNLKDMLNLRFICLSNNSLSDIDGLAECIKLEEITVENNLLYSITGIRHLARLKKLNADNNRLTSISGIRWNVLQSLEVLSMRSNQLQKLASLDLCETLRELYLGNNRVNEFKPIMRLKRIKSLEILDLSENPLCQTLKDYRFRIIHHLTNLRALDGQEVAIGEVCRARDLFEGHLSHELLIEKYGTEEFNSTVRLDMTNCFLKVVDILPSEILLKLESVNLERNQLSSFGGLLFLKQLRVLCLNDNCIETLFPPEVYAHALHPHALLKDSSVYEYISLFKSTEQPIFPHLEVLLLAQNQITCLDNLQLHRMPILKVLFLQHNYISRVTGLGGLPQLKGIVLDYNKIKEFDKLSFSYNGELQELHIEHNRIKELSPLMFARKLKYVYAAGNKLSDLSDLEAFAESHHQLLEISLGDNILTAKQLHRLILIHACPNLQTIDGLSVTFEEKQKCADFYNDLEQQNLINAREAMTSQLTPVHSSQLPVHNMHGLLPGINPTKTQYYASKQLIDKTTESQKSGIHKFREKLDSMTINRFKNSNMLDKHGGKYQGNNSKEIFRTRFKQTGTGDIESNSNAELTTDLHIYDETDDFVSGISVLSVKSIRFPRRA